MPIPPHLPQLQYGYDDGFTTIIFGLIGSCLGCILILLISFFEFKFKKQMVIIKNKTINTKLLTLSKLTNYA